MIKKIERPDEEFFSILLYKPRVTKLDFDFWFDQNVGPINRALDEAVRVYNYYEEDSWQTSPDLYGKNIKQALLINVEEIKQETFEDIIRDLANELPMRESFIEPGCELVAPKKFNEYYKRAKAALAREDEE